MNDSHPSVAAEILKNSASGIAGFAASALLEEQESTGGEPDFASFASWKSHLTQRVLELAAAVELRSPHVFLARVRWGQRAFGARGYDFATLARSLQLLRDACAETLPESASALPLEYLDLSLATPSDASGAGDETVLDPNDPFSKLALEFLESVLSGSAREGLDRLLESLQSGVSAADLYAKVLLPMQREVGILWHLGRLSVTEEHLVTAATCRAMTLIGHYAERAPANGKTVLLAAVSGNTHDLGLRAVSDLFELAGWRVMFLGADVPVDELPGSLALLDVDLLVLSAVLSVQLGEVRESIALVREQCDPIPILVGGSGFAELESAAEAVGADGYVRAIEDAVAAGTQLVETHS